MQLLYAKIKELVCAQATNTNKSGKDYFSTVVPAPCSDLVSLLHSFFFVRMFAVLVMFCLLHFVCRLLLPQNDQALWVKNWLG